MSRSELFRITGAIAFGGALLLMSTSSPAQEDPNSPDVVAPDCVAACHEAGRDCMTDARAAYRSCLDDAACDEARSALRDACSRDTRTEDACVAAREAFRACVGPCRDDARLIGAACREVRTTCFAETCGLDAPPRRDDRHGHPHRRPPHGERRPRRR